jgi:hypothetical protein
MKLFLKYTAIVIGIQILFCIVAIAIVNLSLGYDSPVGVIFLFLYMPTIALVSAVGNFRGESAMIDPILYGVPSGILIYGIIIGRVWSFAKNRRAQRNK